MNTAEVAATRRATVVVVTEDEHSEGCCTSTATVVVVTEDEHSEGKLSTMDDLEWLQL